MGQSRQPERAALESRRLRGRALLRRNKEVDMANDDADRRLHPIRDLVRVRRSLAIAVAVAALGLTGCGGGDRELMPAIMTQILSDPSFDGDIEQTSADSYTVTQGMSANVQSVLAGIDPVAQTEFRAFLDFPLSGPQGVPGDAVIDSAYLEIYVDNIEPTNGSIPILVDLVSFQPPTLIESDFDRVAQPSLASARISGQISTSDVGRYVTVDVTQLMIVAQRAGLPDFQVRILEDLGPAIPVLISINDTTGAARSDRAPLLTVTYF
jgi:hypothetical protein